MTVNKLFRQPLVQNYGKRMMNTAASAAVNLQSPQVTPRSISFIRSFGHRQCQTKRKTLFFVTDTSPHNDLEKVLRNVEFVEMKPSQGAQFNFFVPQECTTYMINMLRGMGY
mmetsp:Transcript_5552/g.20887  ORF Transcript_5552/g.20887 Transcript_5552/m.20887 type:complete len:112 (+) Transcript_5552:284-619(+)|eukprot:CAMPEP_0117449678 /NCGR_PEP_ID=MMETSP0759-20121206/8068_1 /TAXON_ID=63605 /ORGANISM="Percolomonas cosmopolitus, Strain WS" /LENGTH=111 /DNA_ID=CAMNT_0005242159 /DNA_START=185 /DNA_END=520 /DNA_ORIENTATION=+